jgi:hypothetical protein
LKERLLIGLGRRYHGERKGRIGQSGGLRVELGENGKKKERD